MLVHVAFATMTPGAKEYTYNYICGNGTYPLRVHAPPPRDLGGGALILTAMDKSVLHAQGFPLYSPASRRYCSREWLPPQEPLLIIIVTGTRDREVTLFPCSLSPD